MAGRSRGQYQFSFSELLLLAAGFTAASLFIFFMGFYLGRGLSDQHLEADLAVARVPITEPPEFELPLDVEPALDALVETPTEESAAEPEPEPRFEPKPEAVNDPEPEPEKAAVAGIPAGEKPESAAQKQALNEESPDDESSAAEKRQLAEEELEQELVAEFEAGGREAVSDEEAGESLDPSVLAKALVAATNEQKPLTDADLELAPGEGAYTVQLMATRSREEAYGLGHRLRKEGYRAYVKLGDEEGVPWYRVRIGSYQTITEARVVQGECNDELGFKSAYVTMQ
ncbi:MAG: SPOR domain-containing protein [Proteobacteria bacterium]|nr:SPOR domain-containing protein [Pseudomonadota bacterium]